MVNVSTLGQYLDQIARLKGQQQTMGDLTVQVTSGKKSQTLSGLGSSIIATTRARVGVGSLETYSTNITNANRRIDLMQNAIAEIRAQTRNIQGSLDLALQEGDFPDLESIKTLTGSVYDFITDLVNETDGDRYLFGGADTSEPPITDRGLLTSALGEFMPDEADLTNPPLIASGMIGDWGNGTITTEEFIAAYRSTSDTTIGFSNALTTGTAGKMTVRVSDTSEFDYTTLANNTGMKDILRALSVLKELPPVEYAPGALNDPTATTIAEDIAPWPPREKQESFFAVINDLSRMLNSAMENLSQEQFRLSQVQAQTTIVQNSNADQINAYKDIIGEIEDADITEASAKILQMQTQLQASFQITALLSQLTLANYLN